MEGAVDTPDEKLVHDDLADLDEVEISYACEEADADEGVDRTAWPEVIIPLR